MAGASSSTTGPPVVFLDRETNIRKDRFRVLCQIGISACGGIPVYKAILICNFSSDYQEKTIDEALVAVKYVNKITDGYRYGMLRGAAERSLKIHPHRNLILVREPFYHDEYYVVVFPYMRGGSIRNILRTKYPDGMPEELVLIILKELLSGLSAMHQNGIAHGEVTIDNIFINGKPEIKLACSGSIYIPNDELNQPSPSSSKYLPSSTIGSWAAAPEMYLSGGDEISRRGDIWMVGITALELACGKLLVKNRKKLEKAMKKINKKRALPKKDHRALAVGHYQVGEIERGKFSPGFERMVAMCLKWDQAMRPSADQVLECAVFQRLDSPVNYFYTMMRMEPIKV